MVSGFQYNRQRTGIDAFAQGDGTFVCSVVLLLALDIPDRNLYLLFLGLQVVGKVQGDIVLRQPVPDEDGSVKIKCNARFFSACPESGFGQDAHKIFVITIFIQVEAGRR